MEAGTLNATRENAIQLDSTFEIYDCACLPLVGRTYVGTYVLCMRIHVYKHILRWQPFYDELGRNVRFAFRPSFLRLYACMNSRWEKVSPDKRCNNVTNRSLFFYSPNYFQRANHWKLMKFEENDQWWRRIWCYLQIFARLWSARVHGRCCLLSGAVALKYLEESSEDTRNKELRERIRRRNALYIRCIVKMLAQSDHLTICDPRLALNMAGNTN